MYWRDFILLDYSLFYKYHSFLIDKENLSFVYKRKIGREALCYNCVDYLIAVTNDASMAAQHLFNVPKEKITAIYNGIDIKAIHTRTSKSELRQKYHFPENEKIILFAGRLTQMKGLVELVEAFEKLVAADTTQAYRLLICGRGDYDWLYKHVHRYGQITLTGNLSKEQLYECYALADVGVVPSYAEQCSYTAIEMMAAKLPIVVTNVGGLSELITPETGLLTEIQFTPEKLIFNTDDLANQIRTALTSTQATVQRTQKAYLKAKNTLTAETMAIQTLQVYEKLLTPISVATSAKYSYLVSVVILCYNAEKYIKECIESVCAQTYTNIEIIVINDGSTDKTAKILSQIKDNRLKILSNKKNRGIAYSLNKGLEVAQGKYIARLDADDKMLPDRIALQVDFLEQHPTYAMVGSSQILIDEQGNVLQYIAYPETNAEIQAFKYFLNPFSHSTVTLRAEIVKPLGYSKEYLHCEDYALWFRITEKYPVANLPQYTTFQRLHKHNISREKRKEQQENAFALLLDEFDRKELALSDNELKLHSAIFTNKGRAFFNTPEKIIAQKEWIQKILIHFGVTDAILAEEISDYAIA
jgi:glycosyltransferase, family 2